MMQSAAAALALKSSAGTPEVIEDIKVFIYMHVDICIYIYILICTYAYGLICDTCVLDSGLVHRKYNLITTTH